MSSVVKKLIGEISELAYEVTNKTKHDVFVDYKAHVNSIQVQVHINGWENSKEPETILNLSMNWQPKIIKKLKQTKRKLKKLLEE